MKSLDPARVRELFEAAMDLPPDQRAGVLAAGCGGDATLRAEVESLLQHHDATHAGLADTQAGLGLRIAREAGAPPRPPGAAPERIGAYHVTRVLGAGGMGIVYLAEQDDPRRTVAVKVMRGDILTPELLRRFKREAHVLGQLQHPGIAHIYDAGTALLDGVERAYFAMEYIDGVPLTEFARQRGLATRARLELVAQICDAVQHAHDRGVLHRDLKPANILVDASGRPRVLDFGVARATDAGLHTLTLQTDAGQLIGTLQYMSPEQVSGSAPVDVRSDVYALGVIAFELLTGDPPYRVRDLGVADAVRAIQETEPTRLSLIDTRFRGDVETVLAKALEKDRNRRYASAAELAADIRRHLDDQPIVARPATTLYRLRKFARRNKALVTGVAIAFVALTAGFISTTVLYLQANQARRTAEEQREIALRESAIARATNAFLVDDMLAAPNPWTTGSRDMTVAAVLDRASGQVAERFADAPQVEAAVRRTLGESYSALGLHAAAQPHLDRAAEILTRSASDPQQRQATLRRQAGNLQLLGRFDEAEQIITRVLDQARRDAGGDSLAVAEALEVLGDIQNGQSHYDAAEQSLREALRIRRLHTPDGDLDLARATNTLGSALYFRGDHAQAEQVKLEALEQFRRLVGERHPLVAQVLNDLGSNCVEQERYADAIGYLQQARPLLIEQLGGDHPVVLTCERSLGTALSFNGQDAEAAPLLEKSIADTERVLGPAHPDTLAAINCLATSYLRTDRPADAAVLLTTLLERSEAALGPLHAETLKYASNLAWCEVKLGRPETAEPLFRRALDGFEATLGPSHPNTLAALDSLAQLYDDLKRWPDSAACLKRLLDGHRAGGRTDDMDTALILHRYGTSLLLGADYAAARTTLERCVEICEQHLEPHDWRMGIARGKLGDTLSHLGENDAAEALLQASLTAFRTDPRAGPEDVEAGLKRLIAHYDRSGQPERAAQARAELPK